MKNEIIFFLIFYFLFNFLISEISSIQIHPLNEINQACILDLNNSLDYYFYTSVANEKVNEHISYFISKEITEFKISYIFLEKDSYEDLNDYDINNYSFNDASEIMHWKNLFQTIFKSDNKQKGLLLKMKIIESVGNSFNISRINLTFIEPHDITILIPKNQTNYFYIDTNYFQETDVLVFSSYGKKRIKEYYIFASRVNEINNKYGLLFYKDNDNTGKILEVSTNYDESIYINIKFLPKNTLVSYPGDYAYDPSLQQIQLSIGNSGYHEIYYLKSREGYSYFLREIYGNFEATFIYLDDINNLDEVFPDKKNKMIPFDDNIIYQEDKKLILMHFKSINNNPVIFELISVKTYFFYDIDGVISIISYLKEKENTNINIWRDIGNYATIYIEYFGCKLEDNDEIKINFHDFSIITLNKTVKNGKFDVNLNLKNNYVYSDKNCALILSFRKEEISPNITEESYNNLMPKIISYQYPKIEEDFHYNFYFHYESGQRSTLSCSFYYVNSEFIFIRVSDSVSENYNILMNPYNSLEKNHNLTYLINCNHPNVLTNIFYNIKKLKQEDGILDKFFLTGNYTEYKFKKTTKTTKILIQLIGKFHDPEYDFPILYIGKFSKRFHYFSQFFVAPNETIPKIIINGVNILLKVNYFENDIDLRKKILNRNTGFSISSEESEIYKLKINPLFYNEDIQYTIHAYKYIYLYGEKEKFYFERLFENFGNITVNITFVKKSSDVFEFTFDLTGKINSSYENFIIIAKDLKTGYINDYEEKTCFYKEKDNNNNKNTALIIVSVVVSIIIILAIIATIFILRRRKKNKDELNINEREMLTK